MSETLLLPTDFSEASSIGVRAGGELAKRLNASVVLVHVWNTDAIGAPPATLGWSDAKQRALVKEIGARHEQDLNESRALIPDGVDVTTALVDDHSPARAIVSYAEEHDIDLIVIATHGRTGLSRFVLGSVAERVVRLATCRVLTVPAHPAH